MMIEFPPFAFFYLAALAAAVLPRVPRQALMLAVPVASCAALRQLPSDLLVSMSILDLQLEPLRVDRLSRLFGILFHIGAFIGFVF